MSADEKLDISDNHQLDAAAILRRICTIAACGGTGSGVLILVMFNAVARFTPEQEAFLLKVIFILTPVCIAASIPIYAMFCRPFLTYIKACETGEVTDEIRLKAFHWALSCPRRCVAFGYSFYPLCTFIVAVSLALAFDGFDWTQSSTLILCAVLMGFPCEMAMYIPFREALEGVTDKLATEIDDPEVRRAHAPFFSLTRKVTIALMAMSFISITVMASLAQMRAKYSIESLATDRLNTTLESMLVHYDSVEGGEALVQYANETYAHALSANIGFIPADSGQSMDLLMEAGFTETEVEIVRQSSESGSAESVITPNLFAWAQLPDKSGAIVIFSPRKEISDHVHNARGPIIIFAICIIAVTIMTTILFARDLRRTFGALRGQLRRVTQGELGRSNMFELEDELGDLSRDIDAMSGSLRSTVGKVMDTASKVDTAAHDISNVAQHINSVTTGQFQGIIHASDAVASVTAQVDGITSSVHDLTSSVEESTG
ncbi:MAG: methyl-accepting chemotaxis protein, partial [Deltaproteobacteria bacterium]|nr:methyl-accepting chemotaxis protein [Deltaproteobacteria bacterium]